VSSRAMEYPKLGTPGATCRWAVMVRPPLGGVYGKLNEKEGIRSVHTAIDLGINFVDTAPYYGATASETVLGKALKGLPRADWSLPVWLVVPNSCEKFAA
jgi:L-galactose dehydrogenase